MFTTCCLSYRNQFSISFFIPRVKGAADSMLVLGLLPFSALEISRSPVLSRLRKSRTGRLRFRNSNLPLLSLQEVKVFILWQCDMDGGDAGSKYYPVQRGVSGARALVRGGSSSAGHFIALRVFHFFSAGSSALIWKLKSSCTACTTAEDLQQCSERPVGLLCISLSRQKAARGLFVLPCQW